MFSVIVCNIIITKKVPVKNDEIIYVPRSKMSHLKKSNYFNF